MKPNEIFKQPDLDDNLSRSLDPKKQTEFKGGYRAYAVVKNKDDRWACIQVLIKDNEVTRITVFGQLEIEKEFADNEMLKALKFVEKVLV